MTISGSTFTRIVATDIFPLILNKWHTLLEIWIYLNWMTQLLRNLSDGIANNLLMLYMFFIIQIARLEVFQIISLNLLLFVF